MEPVLTTADTAADQESVLEDLFLVEYAGTVRLAYTLVGSNAEAEDLVHDSFVEVSRRLDEIDKPGATVRSHLLRTIELGPDAPPLEG